MKCITLLPKCQLFPEIWKMMEHDKVCVCGGGDTNGLQKKKNEERII